MDSSCISPITNIPIKPAAVNDIMSSNSKTINAFRCFFNHVIPKVPTGHKLTPNGHPSVRPSG